ncbi:hypothetical protein BH09VER1_BH09VER1_51040 [soil metagenome]
MDLIIELDVNLVLAKKAILFRCIKTSCENQIMLIRTKESRTCQRIVGRKLHFVCFEFHSRRVSFGTLVRSINDGIAIYRAYPAAFLAHRFFKRRAVLPAHATCGILEGRQTFLSPPRIETAYKMSHLHQLGRRQRFEIFDNGFQYAHDFPP